MTRVKICGATKVADVEAIVATGAHAIGINFFPGSPRYVATEAARVLLAAIPPLVDAVGVFVNASGTEMREQARHLGLRTVQWHGDGLPDDVAPMQLIPAFRVGVAADVTKVVADCRLAGSRWNRVLIDSFVAGQYGGTGQTVNWDVLDGFDPGRPWILAGGLTPDNVAAAVHRLRPWAVDVCGGVESAPGIKDMHKVRDFIAAVQAAG